MKSTLFLILWVLTGCALLEPHFNFPIPLPEMDVVNILTQDKKGNMRCSQCHVSLKNGEFLCKAVREIECQPLTPKLYSCFDEKDWPKMQSYIEEKGCS